MNAKTIILERVPPSRACAVAAALGAFSIAIVAGLAVDNPVDVILARALASMGACFFVGFAIGSVCEHVVNQHVAAHRVKAPARGAPADEPEIVV